MKACTCAIAVVLGFFLGQGIMAQEPRWVPPRLLFPGELSRVRASFSLESVRKAQNERARQKKMPVPTQPRSPIELLGIEPIEDKAQEQGGGDAPLFEELPPPKVERKMRPLTKEEWRHSA